MAKITLSTIRQAVESKFGAYEVELGENDVVTLLHPFRLSPEARAEMSALGEKEEGESEDTESVITQFIGIIRITAETTAQAEKLVEALSPRGYVDAALLTEVVGGYLESQKVGEASASQD